MLYRKNPKNGDEFGCMRLVVKEDGSIDEERAIDKQIFLKKEDLI